MTVGRRLRSLCWRSVVALPSRLTFGLSGGSMGENQARFAICLAHHENAPLFSVCVGIGISEALEARRLHRLSRV